MIGYNQTEFEFEFEYQYNSSPVFSFIAYIERGVEVKLLFSYWDHTKPDMQFFMKSLMALTGLHRSHNNKIEAKFFKVPAFTPDQAQIPFARVNHNKYMVTDKHGFIGKNIQNLH